MKRRGTGILSMLAAITVSAMLPSCDRMDFRASSSPIRFRVSSSDTKSLPITTGNLASFQIIAVADNDWHDNSDGSKHDKGHYFSEGVSKSGSKWVMGHDHNWLNQVSLHFWCHSPLASGLDSPEKGILSINAPAANSDKIVFGYTLPVHSEGNDANIQKDIVFAGNKESRTFSGDNITGHTSSNSQYDRNDNEVDVVFYHPLSEIRFAVSPTDETFDVSGLGIKSIAITNISGNGTCTFTLPSTFAWSSLGSKDRQYSQSYNATFGSKPDGWTSGTFDNGSQTLYVCSNAFFMIPQTLSGATLSVTFRRTADGSEITKNVELNDTWLPGKYYNYKIKATSLGHDVNFDAYVLPWDEVEYELN